MARYTKDFISEIKNRLKVSDVVGKHLKLIQRGSEFVGLSPFKNEKTPSFTVNDEKEFYHCFSTAEHGDIFSFLMKTKGLSYPESIELLARQAGLDPENGKINDSTSRDDVKNVRLRAILEDAKIFYQENLKKSSLPNNYLEKRQIDSDTFVKFEVGYIGNNNNDLFLYLKSKNHEIEDMVLLGLIKKSQYKENDYYDFFRNRLIFPIKNYKSQVIAFGGRALDDSNIKYINSSDSQIFKKSFNLYNINIAIEDRRQLEHIYVVEGYIDVVSLYQNGFKTTVAPLGTAITKFQIESLWKYCKKPTIIFDGDEAGQKAALRAAKLCLSILKPGRSLRFCILPKDNDPDDYLKKNSINDFQKLIENALDLSDYIWMKEYKKFELSTPEEKADFDKNIKEIIKLIEDKTIAAYYNKDFNDRLNLLKKQKITKTYNFKKFKSYSSASKETQMSERANFEQPESVTREKIIAYISIENLRISSKYIEELGSLGFNDDNLSKICSKIVDFVSQSDKNLENSSLKTYLMNSGFQNTIRSIYQPELIKTYKLLINKNQSDLERSFEELINIQKRFLNDDDLNQAASDLEKNMDEKSFENFVKLKKESLNKNILK